MYSIILSQVQESELGRRAKRDSPKMECVFSGEDETSLTGLACKLKAEKRQDYSK